MKIIGRTSDGFILQAGKTEVARLIGFRYESDCEKKLQVGADLPVAAMFSQLYGLTQASKCIESLQEKAQTLIDELANHPAAPILEGIKVGPE